MEDRALAISGAFEFVPQQVVDSRGLFLELFRADRQRDVLGRQMPVIQSNLSVSARGVLRGVHFSQLPTSQAKYVTAVAGSFWDFVVDVRVGSPTFGRWDKVLLDSSRHNAVYLAEGLGHAVYSREDDSTLLYLCSTAYAPQREQAVHPLDPDLGLDIPRDVEPILSAKDSDSLTLARARDQGFLPSWADCQSLYAAMAQQ